MHISRSSSNHIYGEIEEIDTLDFGKVKVSVFMELKLLKGR